MSIHLPARRGGLARHSWGHLPRRRPARRLRVSSWRVGCPSIGGSIRDHSCQASKAVDAVVSRLSRFAMKLLELHEVHDLLR